ncbi:14895_t:CDS:1, partial [Dentiscutata heterogama]
LNHDTHQRKRGEIISAQKLGKSYRQIAKLFRYDPKTVGNMLNRLENPSQILPNRQGRPPTLDELAQDHLSQLVL